MNARSAGAFASGLLFGIGLLVAGMTRPEKVVGFFRVSGAWDPSLAMVMVGGIAVHALTRLVILKRRAPLFAPCFDVPVKVGIDRDLVLGAVVFGVGWGLGGFCPGPAVVAAASAAKPAILFVAAMVIGMRFEETLRRIGAREETVPACDGGDEGTP